MSGPKRIQMSRQRPWRDRHPDAKIVDRRTQWGNPFVVARRPGRHGTLWIVEDHLTIERDFDGQPIQVGMPTYDRDEATRWAVANYRNHMTSAARSLFLPTIETVRALLHGRDLACWCPLDQPCHADVLLELANVDDDRGSVTLAALSPLISAVALVVVWFMANHTETARSLFLLGLVFVALVGLVLRPLAKALLRCADRLDLEDWTARRLVEAGRR